MFADTIIALNKGATVAELNDKLAEVVAAVRATARPGKLAFTLKIKPGSKGNVDIVFLEPEIKTYLPTMERESTLFYTTDDNRLTRRDERQRELFPANARVVEVLPGGKASEAREVCNG